LSEQACPKCMEQAFTWSIDEEVSPLTVWFCSLCKYKAFADESDERNCLKCKMKSESKLKDDNNEFWWCCSCNTISIIGGEAHA